MMNRTGSGNLLVRNTAWLPKSGIRAKHGFPLHRTRVLPLLRLIRPALLASLRGGGHASR